MKAALDKSAQAALTNDPSLVTSISHVYYTFYDKHLDSRAMSNTIRLDKPGTGSPHLSIFSLQQILKRTVLDEANT